jgi:hypothetical protein
VFEAAVTHTPAGTVCPIQEFAKRASSPRALYHYEHLGRLKPSGRSDTGYRLYNPEVKAKVEERKAIWTTAHLGPARALHYAEAQMKLIGILLIVFGVVALALGGIQYTTREKVLDIGPLEATAEKHKTIPLSPIVGIASLAGGVALVLAGAKTRA